MLTLDEYVFSLIFDNFPIVNVKQTLTHPLSVVYKKLSIQM